MKKILNKIMISVVKEFWVREVLDSKIILFQSHIN